MYLIIVRGKHDYQNIKYEMSKSTKYVELTKEDSDLWKLCKVF